MTDTVRAAPTTDTPAQAGPEARSGAGLLGLAVGSIGVVYGDIGTSPLYAFREAIVAASTPDTGELVRTTVLGVLSLILWALFIVVTLEVRRDPPARGQQRRGRYAYPHGARHARTWQASRAAGFVALLGIISAALFYGDAVITPALSVLSAIEGIDVATPALHAYVVPITVVILIMLFAFQSRGTAKVAALFGPITSVWFVAIAIPGVLWIARDPGVLWALDPAYGFAFVTHHGMISLYTLGAVFLAVTGAEALYADLGHFGRLPIQIAWSGLVLPSLALNYLGQGALVFAHPEAVASPFFLLYPDWARIPMVVLAAVATVIASQAVITGAYSLTSQAIQLGLLPRLEIRHTSAHAGRPDLHAARERAAADRRAPPGGAVPLVERARLGLRHRRHRHHGRHRHDGIRRRLADVALVAYRRCGADCAVPVHRPDLSRRQHAQGRRRRLGAAGARRRADAGHVHLAARQPAPVREDPPPGNAARRPGAHPGEEAAGAGAGDGGVPHRRSL